MSYHITDDSGYRAEFADKRLIVTRYLDFIFVRNAVYHLLAVDDR